MDCVICTTFLGLLIELMSLGSGHNYVKQIQTIIHCLVWVINVRLVFLVANSFYCCCCCFCFRCVDLSYQCRNKSLTCVNHLMITFRSKHHQNRIDEYIDITTHARHTHTLLLLLSHARTHQLRTKLMQISNWFRFFFFFDFSVRFNLNFFRKTLYKLITESFQTFPARKKKKFIIKTCVNKSKSLRTHQD